MLDMAVEYQIVDKSGSWFTYEGERLVRAARRQRPLASNPDLWKRLTTRFALLRLWCLVTSVWVNLLRVQLPALRTPRSDTGQGRVAQDRSDWGNPPAPQRGSRGLGQVALVLASWIRTPSVARSMFVPLAVARSLDAKARGQRASKLLARSFRTAMGEVSGRAADRAATLIDRRDYFRGGACLATRQRWLCIADRREHRPRSVECG